MQRIEAKRIKLFGKEGQNKSLKYIEMVEMKKIDGNEKKKKWFDWVIIYFWNLTMAEEEEA